MSVRPLASTELKRLHRAWHRRTSGRIAVLLDSVMTPANVGSIVRLAAAYRVESLLLAGATASVTHPGARKTSMATERFVDVRSFPAADEAMTFAAERGWGVVGIELVAGAVPLFDLALPADVCLAFGHEDHGLSAAVLRRCDALAYLPLLGKVGSLNVATAAGIALYEARRQGWAAP